MAQEVAATEAVGMEACDQVQGDIAEAARVKARHWELDLLWLWVCLWLRSLLLWCYRKLVGHIWRPAVHVGQSLFAWSAVKFGREMCMIGNKVCGSDLPFTTFVVPPTPRTYVCDMQACPRKELVSCPFGSSLIIAVER